MKITHTHTLIIKNNKKLHFPEPPNCKDKSFENIMK